MLTWARADAAGGGLYAAPGLAVGGLRITLAPQAELRLPWRQRGSVLHGTLGRALERACGGGHGRRPGRAPCAGDCAYRSIFQPGGPPPFVLRPPLEADLVFGPARPLSFEMRLLGRACRQRLALAAAWGGVRRLNGVPVTCARVDDLGEAPLAMAAAGASPAGAMTVAFLSPTELKRGGALQPVPTPAALIASVCGRIADLCRAYGDAPWDADHAALRALAAAAAVTAAEGGWQRDFRRSASNGHRHALGGFVGTITYAGLAPPLLPLLRMGALLNVGHAAAWGHGRFEVA